jgi:hypothetical protein
MAREQVRKDQGASHEPYRVRSAEFIPQQSGMHKTAAE